VIYNDYTKKADKNPQQCYLEKNNAIWYNDNDITKFIGSWPTEGNGLE